jgi:hypothetical protein
LPAYNKHIREIGGVTTWKQSGITIKILPLPQQLAAPYFANMQTVVGKFEDRAKKTEKPIAESGGKT